MCDSMMVNPVVLDEIRLGETYERERAQACRDAVALKRHRRIALGSVLCLVFENHDTVRSALEEVLRGERITDRSEVAAELAIFNTLVPDDRELSATLYFDISDPVELRTHLTELDGIERHVYIDIDGARVVGGADEVRVEEGGPNVYHLRFVIPEIQVGQWRGGRVVVGTTHPGYEVATELTEEQRWTLADDLT